jgi:hypothetical protein
MALDIHRSDTNEHIFGINDDQYNCLDDIFEQFQKTTGIYIDKYSDTYLSIGNINLLVKLIDEYVQRTDLNINKNKTIKILEFKGLLNYLLAKDLSLKLIGD